MLPVGDIFGGIATLITGLIRTHKMDVWAVKIYAQFLSCVIAYTGADGRALRAGESVLQARGEGLMAVAAVLCVAVLLDPKLRGSFVLSKEDEKNIHLSDYEVVEKK